MDINLLVVATLLQSLIGGVPSISVTGKNPSSSVTRNCSFLTFCQHFRCKARLSKDHSGCNAKILSLSHSHGLVGMEKKIKQENCDIQIGPDENGYVRMYVNGYTFRRITKTATEQYWRCMDPK